MKSLLRSALIALLLLPTAAFAATDPPDDTDGTVDGSLVVARRLRPPAAAATLKASAEPSDWSFGLSLPVSRFGFTKNADGSYGGNVTPLQAGVGASIWYHAVQSKDGSVPVGVGAMLFGATDLSASKSDSGLGIAIGPSFWNNTFAVMAGVDLYRRIGSQDTGLLMANAGGRNGFERHNFFVLFNFGIGLGKSAPGSLKIAP